MNSKTKARYQARADVLKAMAHPTRLFIVETLAQKSHCVAELTDLIGDDMSTVSKHLSVLKGVGIISGEKSGVQVYYSLCMPCVMNFFGCIETVLKESARNHLWLVQ